MKEAEWLVTPDLSRLLSHLASTRRRISSRKYRLLICACARRLWDKLPDPRSRRAVEVAEQFVDGQASRKELAAAHAEANAVPRRAQRAPAHLAVDATYSAVGSLTNANPWGEQADLLRHLIGNPFQPHPPARWNATVAGLAQALYDGIDNRQILADALEEAGHVDLAEHFRQEKWHPKGCWVVDLILGQK